MAVISAREKSYRVLSINSSKSIQGILLHIERLTLKRKILFIYLYSIEEELILFKPNLKLFTSNFPEDTLFKGLSDVWLEVNTLFEDFKKIQFSLRVKKIHQDSDLTKLFNQCAKDKRHDIKKSYCSS